MEFSFVGGTDNPAYYVGRALCVFTGFFVVWPLAVYHMFGAKVKSALSLLFPFAFGIALLNAYVFCYDYGLMDVFFKLDNRYLLENYSAFYSVLPISVAVLVAGVLCITVKRNGSKHITSVVAAFCIAEVALSAISDELILDKYNEAASVMPKLFLDAEYSVTIGEPQDKYCVYNNDSYKRFDGVKAYYLENKLGTPYMIERGDTYKSIDMLLCIS